MDLNSLTTGILLKYIYLNKPMSKYTDEDNKKWQEFYDKNKDDLESAVSKESFKLFKGNSYDWNME